MSTLLKDTREHWQAIGPLLTIRSEPDYAAAIERLQSLLAEIGTDEQHPLYGLLDTLGTLIHAYEEEYVSIPEASGPEVLEYLMEEHGLEPEDLPELDGAQAVRAVLGGTRELHIGEIRALAERFRVSPAVFI
ncbi:MAG TPA: transcriptional regulator [Thermoanaerobaculia bacterium]|jgi:HTH-type transcriptional regulator/antitoxin HigA|nr:transcriptional regulator [Thermoanaerobaculia bacterium]